MVFADRKQDYKVVYQVGGKRERDALIMRSVTVRVAPVNLDLILKLARLMDHWIESINLTALPQHDWIDVELTDERFTNMQMRRWVNGVGPERAAYEKYLYEHREQSVLSFDQWAYQLKETPKPSQMSLGQCLFHGCQNDVYEAVKGTYHGDPALIRLCPKHAKYCVIPKPEDPKQ